MKTQFLAVVALSCFATLSLAESKYKDNVDACNSAFVAAVTAVESDAVSVKFNNGLTRTLSSQEQDAREPLAVGSPVCLQDDAE